MHRKERLTENFDKLAPYTVGLTQSLIDNVNYYSYVDCCRPFGVIYPHLPISPKRMITTWIRVAGSVLY